MVIVGAKKRTETLFLGAQWQEKEKRKYGGNKQKMN
jgi:hypothetical protein